MRKEAMMALDYCNVPFASELVPCCLWLLNLYNLLLRMTVWNEIGFSQVPFAKKEGHFRTCGQRGVSWSLSITGTRGRGQFSRRTKEKYNQL